MANFSKKNSANGQKNKEAFFARRSAVTSIIILTSIISLFGFIFSGIYPGVEKYFSLQASSILHGQFLWTLLAHVFFHANLIHLIVNMFSLFFVGGLVEMIIGKKRFIWFYLLSGIFAGIIFVASAYLGNLTGLTSVFGSLDVMAVGASGAIFGLVGMLAVIIPNKKVYLIVGPILLIILEVVLSGFNAGWAAFLLAIINILMFVMIFSIFMPRSKLYKLAIPVSMPMWAAPIAAILPLVLVSLFIDLPIGNSAHFGGLLAGLLYGYYLQRRYKKKILLLRRIIR